MYKIKDIQDLVLSYIDKWRCPFNKRIAVRNQVFESDGSYKYVVVGNTVNHLENLNKFTYTGKAHHYAYSITIPYTDVVTNDLKESLSLLVKTAEQDVARMLYGDSRGILAKVEVIIKDEQSYGNLSTVQYFHNGQNIDVFKPDGTLVGKYTVKNVGSYLDSSLGTQRNYITTFPQTEYPEFNPFGDLTNFPKDSYITLSNRYNKEMTGLDSFVTDDKGQSDIVKVYGYPIVDYYIPFFKARYKTLESLSCGYILHCIDDLRQEYSVDNTYINAYPKNWVDMYMDVIGYEYSQYSLDNQIESFNINKITALNDGNVQYTKMWIADTNDFMFIQDHEWKPTLVYNDDNTVTITISKRCELIATKPYKIQCIRGGQL